MFILFFALVIPVALFAQIEPPTDWSDIILNPQKWFLNIGAFALLTAFVATFVNGLLKVVKKWPRQFVAWGVAIILLVASDLINFGYAAEFPILLAVSHGLVAGWGSNSAYDLPWVKAILTWLEDKLNPNLKAQKVAANK